MIRSSSLSLSHCSLHQERCDALCQMQNAQILARLRALGAYLIKNFLRVVCREMKNAFAAIICCTISMFSSSLSLSKHPEVVVLGSIAVDFVAYTNVLPQIGETVFGTSFAKNFGGKGANQVTSEMHFQLEC
jgi:hypothetical protein